MQMKLLQNEGVSAKTMQLLFLIAAGIVIYPALFVDGLFPGYGTYALKQYIAVPCMLFFGSALTQRLSSPARRCMLLSVVTVLWFVAVQIRHWLGGMGNSSFGLFVVAYLLAFPYAAVTEDSRKQAGMKWIGGFYVAYSMVMVILAGLLLLDLVPEALAESVKWEGSRASIISHPNGGGCILMLGIGCSMYFLTQSEKKWVKCLWVVLAALQFLVLSLTNSRTTILLTSAIFGGTLFFVIWDGGWKRFLAGAAAALVVIACLFSLSGYVFKIHSQVQLNKVLEQDEDVFNENQFVYVDENTGEYILAGSNGTGQGELSQDMDTLNGRTYIWEAAFTALQDNPDLKKWGTEFVAAEISYRNDFPVVNAHNSWIQILMLQGRTGFLLALAYTVVAVWNIWILMWRKQEDLSKKVVAMIVICLLLAGILEAYLFTGELLFTHFLFFLCTGYLVQWNAEASGKV